MSKAESPVKNILIVKLGALGDVVRTSFFAQSLKKAAHDQQRNVKIFWYTHETSLPLIRFNPYIDVIVTSLDRVRHIEFDEVYSLEDEVEVIEALGTLKSRETVGASLNADGKPTYCERSGEWFDMGLLSKVGKARADQLKVENRRSHSEIFCDIFQVAAVNFKCYNSPEIERWVSDRVRAGHDDAYVIGVNAFAGNRWPAKSLVEDELLQLVGELRRKSVNDRRTVIVLIGAGDDCKKNARIIEALRHPSNVMVLNTDENVLELMALVGSLDLLITSDSLCLHLATGQAIPTVSFFAPTSAAEIENNTRSRKILSTSSDYCCYRPTADNSSITASRIISAVSDLIHNLEPLAC